MKKILTPILSVLLLNPVLLSAQERIQPGWQLFYSNYEWVPGAVNVNMQLIGDAPKTSMPYLLIVGAKYSNCTADGFPLTDEYNVLFDLSDSIMQILSKSTTAELTGTFTCQCKRTDYIYVTDTTGIRTKLYIMYNRSFKQYSPLLWIKPDAGWEAYRTFLYPTEEKLELTLNEKLVSELANQGDISTIPRPVNHYIYFTDKKSRLAFIEWAKSQNYTIGEMKKERGREKKFMVEIIREDFIEAAHFTHITMEIRQKLKEMNGEYDHWECAVKAE